MELTRDNCLRPQSWQFPGSFVNTDHRRLPQILDIITERSCETQFLFFTKQPLWIDGYSLCEGFLFEPIFSYNDHTVYISIPATERGEALCDKKPVHLLQGIIPHLLFSKKFLPALI